MTITKPNTLSIVAGAAIFVAFISAFLAWVKISVSVPKELQGMVTASGGDSVTGDLFDMGGKGKVLFVLILIALILWIATLFIQAFPPNVQMPLMGAPIFLAIIGVLSLLFGILCAADGGFGKTLGVEATRGYGMWIGLLAIIVWTAVSAIQAKPLLEAAKAMKAAQQTPPPAGPPAV